MIVKALPVAVAAAAFAGSAAAPAQGSQVLQLDARGPDVASAPLAPGATYYARVTGTASIWSREQWSLQGTICGSAEAGPMYPSSGSSNGPVGFDAETIFAVPPGVAFTNFQCVPSRIPMHVLDQTPGGFQIGVGGQYSHAEPLGGAFAVPRADHTYTYRLTGTGAPVSFRFDDGPVDDNYGVFQIAILAEAECQAENCIAAATTPPATSAPTSPTSPTTPGAAVKNAVALATFSTKRRCSSRPYVSLRLRPPAGVKLRSAVIKYGKRTIRLSGAKLKRSVHLRKVPRGAFKVRVSAVTTRGQTLTLTRSFKKCAKGKR